MQDKKFFQPFKEIKKVNRDNQFLGDFSAIVTIDKNSEDDKNFIGSAVDKKRLAIFLSFIFLLISALFLRIFYLQIIKGDYYLGIAEGNRIKIEIIKAKRGVIYDKNLKQIVFNRPNFSLVIIPNLFFNEFCQIKKNEDCDEFCHVEKRKYCKDSALNFIIELFQNKEYNENFINNLKLNLSKLNIESKQETILNENIAYQDALNLKNSIQNIDWLDLKIDSMREYLPLVSMSHWIGYTGRISPEELEIFENEDYLLNDYIGKTGVEKYYEKKLKGNDGKKEIEVNALGEEKEIMSITFPENGLNLRLTIDYELQEEIENIIKRQLVKIKKHKAAVVAIDPRNGEILTLVSLPSFLSNDFAYKIETEKYQSLLNDIDKPLFHRAVMGEYPSGSIIKPVIAVAALEEGIITRHTSFLSTGGISIGGWFFPDWQSGGHGSVNVRKAIANSVNTFFYIVGGGYNNFNGLGIEKMKEYEEKFGLNNKTGIDLPYEARGFLPTKDWKKETRGEDWYIGDTYNLAIGQGDLLITPLQAAVFTSIIANGGIYYRPHLLKKILNEDGKIIKEIKPEIVRENFISKKNLHIVAMGMRDCVTYGSCRWLADLPVKAAGKTGTAQHSKDKYPHAWFTCFAPFDNPEIVLAVLIEEGEGGSKIAAPIAKEILKWYFNKN
ncbi:MAG: penicillin-binding protein 2 [Patescibacteria group bacterium]|nr:penicillin-binding protein 2 [Patescibacteria group bacterium]